MRIVYAVAALALVNSPARAQHDGGVTYWTPNANTCAKILELETVRTQYRMMHEDFVKSRNYGMVVGWLQGYVSATNAFHPKSNGNLLKTMNAGELMTWLLSYCRNDPTADIYAIINALHKVMKITP